MQGFALLGGKALGRRLEDENDKHRKLIEARCLGYALKILSFIVSSPRDTDSNTNPSFSIDIRGVLFNGEFQSVLIKAQAAKP